MNGSKSPGFLKSERDRTNASLSTERKHTNESLKNERFEVEASTDENIKEARTDANREHSFSRHRADREKADVSRESETPRNENAEGMDRLIQERSRADQTTVRERAQTDAIITREREVKWAHVRDLVEKERAVTDRHLNEERFRTDTEVKRVSGLLSDEVATHLKTKAALTSRDEFLAIVSHDLRNPIGAISSCTEMLLEDSNYQNMDPEIKHWIEFIKRNAQAALSLINDILDIERIAEGKLYLQFEEHSVTQVIRESIENFVRLASAKNILIRSKAPNEIGSAIFDRERIRQVLWNLIGNAIKFTSEGGMIILDASLKDDNVLISVSDSGPGIPAEKQNRIFERFAQIGMKDRTGLGLGLYISRMLIEAHRGKIWVESEVGRGSTFWLEFPAHAIGNRDRIH